MRLLKPLFPHIRQDPSLTSGRSWLAGSVVFHFAAGLLLIAQAALLSQVIARVFLGGETLSQVLVPLFVLLGVFLLRALAVSGGEYSARQAAIRVKSSLRMALITHLLRLGPAYTRQERTGELTNIATEGIEALDAYYSQYLPQLALAALIPLAVLLVVFPLDSLTGIVLLVTAPLLPLFMVLIGKSSEAATRRQFHLLGRLSAHFLDILQGLTALKQLGRSRDQARTIDQVSQQYRQVTLQVLRITFLSAFALELVATLSTAIVAVEISLRLLAGRLGFEQSLLILILAPEFYLPLRTLGMRFHAGTAGITAARRISQVLDTPLPPTPEKIIEIPAPPFAIHFDRVTYTYPDSGEPVLNDVSFSILPGQHVALVGPSGAGKSTLAQLLLGFIQPVSGCIRVNGTCLENLEIEAWREQIAWVPQLPHLFHGTLESNLRVARPGCSDAQLIKACRLAGLQGWIDSLPQGLQSPIGEAGARLSGGEAQRLALARAFLKDAPLLLLDEPTAFLDPQLEEGLIAAVQQLVVGRTVLSIAHRLGTVRSADRILVLENGRLVESGTHTELISKPGAYHRLVTAWQGRAA